MDRAAPPPSVDALARSLADLELPQPLLVDAARAAIAEGAPERARELAVEIERSLLQPVVNATGVLLHTNLGRAPVAIARAARAASVELDLSSGRRGQRGAGLARLFQRLTGAEDALVVNNGAAAVLLCLTALAGGEEVVVSRGELVEIGGGFRIPEVLAASGARLVEVGTTNRTRRADYEAALAPREGRRPPAVLLKVHPSNYTMTGFVEQVGVAALATLGPPVVADLGSGLLDATTPWLRGGPPRWLATEPAVRQSLEAGAALVTFSGDKLLGGPQAGIIAGRADLVGRCRRHPLARALRPGGLVLEALQETLLSYLRRDATAIPLWRMATAGLAELRQRAEALAGQAAACGLKVSVVECAGAAGGGSLPGVTIPSVGVRVPGDRTGELRAHRPAVVATVGPEGTTCDLRSVDPADDAVLAAALAALASGGPGTASRHAAVTNGGRGDQEHDERRERG